MQSPMEMLGAALTSWPRMLVFLILIVRLNCEQAWTKQLIGTFRSDYEYEYEYEFFIVYPVRMPDCVRLSRQLVLSSKSGRLLDTNYEIFNKFPPRLRVHYRCKGELKG